MKSLSRKPERVRRISAGLDSGKLLEDLAKLKNKAIELGASEAFVIENKDLILNPGIFKCMDPDNAYPSI
jgi:hypothetical protein